MAESNKRRKPQKRKRTASSGSRARKSTARGGASSKGTSSSAKKRKPAQRSGGAGTSSRGKGATKRPAAKPVRGTSRPAAKKRPSTQGKKASTSRKRGRPGPTRGRGKKRPGSSKKKAPPSRRRRILIIAAVVMLVLVAILAITAGVVYAQMSRDLPDLDEPLRGSDQTSKVYDRNGVLLAELFAEQNRTRVALADIPVDLRNAVIAVEDERYYEHQGVDPIGIARALWVDIRTRSTAQGGSTITQQYVVNAFVERESTLERKIKEAILAYRLEKDYSKDEILEMYLNMIYFGHGAYSIETAAQAYFGKPVTELTLPESAMLAGVIRSPGSYSPYLDPEAAVARRDLVLGKLLEQEFITKAQHDEAVATEIVVVGLKPSSARAPYFVEYVKAQLAEEYGEDALYRGGLEVRTTLDVDDQRAAETAVLAALDQPDDPSAALVALEPSTGEIRAMVGGRDFDTQQFNVAAQGRRQPGSSFKPFVLATALEQGIPSEQTYDCGPITIQVPHSGAWKVTGAHGGRSGPMRLREATHSSVNSVFAQVIMEVGADRVVETANRMGIESEILPVPAIALGGLDTGVSPLEMASAYGTLANGGVHAESQSVLEVKDHGGEVLFAAESVLEEVLDPAVAYLTTDMLRGVISNGTGRAAAIGRDAAGKTGTTQEYRDAWFVGYTPELAAAVWVGYPEEQIEMKSVHGRTVTGGSFPAEIWAEFMKGALSDVEATSFVKPGGLTSLGICLDTGEQLTEFCERRGTGLFLSEAVPDSCHVHTGPQLVELPNMIGKTKEEAIALLNQLQLLYNVRSKFIDGVPKGIVADQEPPGGSEITTDTVVTIVVSRGQRPSEPPEPDFSYAPEDPLAGEEVHFDASASTDDGTIVSWVWEMGDGAQEEGRKVVHVFELAGSYEVTLWVTDDEGQADSLTVTVEVN